MDQRDIPPTQGPRHGITHKEVDRQLIKIKNSKSSRADGIPIEALQIT